MPTPRKKYTPDQLRKMRENVLLVADAFAYRNVGIQLHIRWDPALEAVTLGDSLVAKYSDDNFFLLRLHYEYLVFALKYFAFDISVSYESFANHLKLLIADAHDAATRPSAFECRTAFNPHRPLIMHVTVHIDDDDVPQILVDAEEADVRSNLFEGLVGDAPPALLEPELHDRVNAEYSVIVRSIEENRDALYGSSNSCVFDADENFKTSHEASGDEPSERLYDGYTPENNSSMRSNETVNIQVTSGTSQNIFTTPDRPLPLTMQAVEPTALSADVTKLFPITPQADDDPLSTRRLDPPMPDTAATAEDFGIDLEEAFAALDEMMESHVMATPEVALYFDTDVTPACEHTTFHTTYKGIRDIGRKRIRKMLAVDEQRYANANGTSVSSNVLDPANDNMSRYGNHRADIDQNEQLSVYDVLMYSTKQQVIGAGDHPIAINRGGFWYTPHVRHGAPFNPLRQLLLEQGILREDNIPLQILEPGEIVLLLTDDLGVVPARLSGVKPDPILPKRKRGRPTGQGSRPRPRKRTPQQVIEAERVARERSQASAHARTQSAMNIPGTFVFRAT